MDQLFSHNFVHDDGVTIKATSGSGNESELYDTKNMLSDNDEFWTPDDGSTTATIDVKFPKAVEVNCFMNREAIHLGQRVEQFHLEYYDANGQLPNVAHAGTIGAKYLIRMTKVMITDIKYTIEKSEATPTIREIRAFRLVGAFALDNEPPITPKQEQDPTPTSFNIEKIDNDWSLDNSEKKH